MTAKHSLLQVMDEGGPNSNRSEVEESNAEFLEGNHSQIGFSHIPTEVHMNIFQFLSQSDLRAARLVSRKWNVIALEFVHLSNKIMDDDSYPTISGECVKLKLPKLTITSLKSSEVRDSPFANASSVETLCLENPKISLENLKWIFEKCSRLEILQIQRSSWDKNSRGRFNAFLNNILLPALVSGFGANIKKLEFYAGAPVSYKVNKGKPYHFDCSLLRKLHSLESFNVYSAIPFVFTNFEEFPETVKRFSFILVMGWNDANNHGTLATESISKHFKLTYLPFSNCLPNFPHHQVDTLRELMPNLRSVLMIWITWQGRAKFMDTVPAIIKRLNRNFVHTILDLHLVRSPVVGWVPEF